MATPSTTSTTARALAVLIVIVALGSVAMQVGLNMRDGASLAEVLAGMSRYFTILTNVLVAATFALVAANRAVSPRWLLCMASAIAGVGIVYHAALARYLTHEGWEIIADQGVHTAAPMLTVMWFIALIPKRIVRWRDVPLVVIWPMLYCFYALGRGSLTGDYVYFFIDANTLSVTQMTANIAGLTVFFALLGAACVWFVKLRPARR
ncbi:Pr6Pr family membrane protein [Aurantiacibacter sediminis]|uniref:Pr6Pr family membrane protein n=1 Tax=Aurantiacibacter sediminis TaxID=2793064 RepID=A0ABS0MZ75_9SPHN|nr:Pr6Pr family membrane protein [Aurantiacibacter sediminis]MBH5321020.1 Pr6Pr family membrane protein [Aurantiacibacter sediminis]